MAFNFRPPRLSRREFLAASGLLALSAAMPGCKTGEGGWGPEPIIDIHQHLGYSGRSDEVLLAHQRAMGVTKTILLPAGRPVNTASTHDGRSNGLEAQCLGNKFCYRFAKAHPRHYLFAACEVPDLPDAAQQIEKYLKLGGGAIAELKASTDPRIVDFLNPKIDVKNPRFKKLETQERDTS